jgi:DNA-binding beta-propeller fold protein YncE
LVRSVRRSLLRWTPLLMASGLLLSPLSLSLLLSTAGCGGSAGTGDILVIVKDVSMTSVAGAQVTTDPTTTTATTDGAGTALFSKVATGFYAITAQGPTGAARAAITVTGGKRAEVTLVLHKVTGVVTGTGGGSGGGAGGAGGAGGSSGLGGAAGATDGGPPPSPDGGGDGSTSHPDGGPTSGTVVLGAPTKDSNGVNLAWTAQGSFSTYRIYRGQGSAGGFSVIDVLNAPPALTYRDETVALGVTYQYRIGAVTGGASEVLSNTQTVTAGVFIAVNSQVEKMKVDRKRAFLYAIDRVNNSLHFVDLTNQTVSSTIFVGSTPTDLDIDASGDQLFIANFGGTEIAVVDLNTQLKSRSLFVDTSVSTWNGNPYRLACTANNTLVFTSQDQWQDLKLVRTSDGGNITVAGTLYEPGLAANPDGTRVYATGDDINGLARYDLGNNALTASDGSGSGIASGGPVIVSGDGMFVFAGAQKYLANNLKSVLGSFGESIVAVTHDGSIAVGSTRIFDGTTFSAKKSLPLTTTVLAISSDDKTVYLYDTMTSRIYVYQL